MLNNLLVRFVVIILLVTGLLYPSNFTSVVKVNAQNDEQVNTQNDQIAGLLKQMQAADWNSRFTAFYQLLNLAFGA